MVGELQEYLIQEGYRFFDAGGQKENLMIYLLQCRDNYQNSGGIQNQRYSNEDLDNTNRNQRHSNQDAGNATQNANVPIVIEHRSGLDFWDIIFLSCLFNRGGNTTNIHNYNVPSTESRDKRSDDRVLGPCIIAFCLIFLTVVSYFLLAYAAYKIKNAKLENNKYSVPSAVFLGILSFSVSATLTLLLSGIIVPNLENAMGLSKGAFTAFQIIVGLNAVIFGLGAIAFFYLGIDKVSKKALVDREVDQIIYSASPHHCTINDQQPQYFSYQTQDNQPSAPPPPYSEFDPSDSQQSYSCQTYCK